MKNIYINLILLLLTLGVNAQKIEKVEPSFWWVGMHNTELQILIHGDQISELTPSIDYDGVVLQETIKVDSPNYLFLNLSIDPETSPGDVLIKFKKGKKTKLTYNYSLKQRAVGSSERQGFDNTDVMYLVTPDRFANGDPSNDSVKETYQDTDRNDAAKRHGGDIQGIRDHLDYIEEMGFTSLWICPLLESNQPEYSYHGYAITDYYKIDPRYGSNQDYLDLVKEANKRGIKVIMDQVNNHNGRYHYWTEDLPTKDWYHYADQKNDPPYTNHKRTVLADPYAPKSEIVGYTDGWFVDRMPDLNQSNELLANYLIQNSIFWIEYAGVQGIRQDTYSYADPKFSNEWSAAIMNEYPNFNIVGEEWSVNPAIVARWQAGKVNADGFVSSSPSMMDFPNQQAIINSLNKGVEPWKNSFDEAYEMLANDFLYPNPSNLVIFLDNHDMARIFDQVNENLGLYNMGLIYLYTMRGIPQVYYGTEILMSYPENPSDHGKLRIDMPGGWTGDEVNAFEGVGLSEEALQAQNTIKTLNHLRTEHKALQTGKLVHYIPKDETYVMFRVGEEESFMSIFNKNEEAYVLDLSRFKETIKENQQAIDVLTGKVYQLDQGTIEIPATSALMLQLK